MRYFIIIISLIFASCTSNKNASQDNHDGHSHESENSINHNRINYFDSYTLKNSDFGTETIVTVNGKTRTMVTNALPNHKTGEFPRKGNPNTISAQNKTYTFPISPKYTGIPQWVREPGVALNGVKFEPGTAEVVECETCENYRVEAFQDVIDLGLDFNKAHVQPTGAYHYHGAPTSVVENFDTGDDLVHVGFAHDGFPVYYSKIGKYKPSYKALTGNREGEDCTYENPKQTIEIAVGGHHDGTFTSDFEYVEGSGDLDECNGITIEGNYLYLITNEFPYVSRCLMGDYEDTRPQRGEGRPNGRQSDGLPSFEDLLQMMDTNNDKKISKDEAKGPLSDQFNKIDANSDGFLSKGELEKGGIGNRQRPQSRRPQGRRN